MKRLLSVVLVSVMLLSVAIIPAFGFSDDAVRIYRRNFTDKYVKPYDAADGYYFYFEQYYHYADEASPDESEPDWVLVYAGDMSYTDGKVKKLVSDRVFFADESSSPFVFKYAVYDVKEDTFYDLDDSLLEKYEGLDEALRVEKAGAPLGDADMDKRLSVMDATQIQMAMARMLEFDAKDDLSEYSDLGGDVKYISDFDQDGVRSVMDATAIQFRIAKIGEDPEDPTEPTDMM